MGSKSLCLFKRPLKGSPDLFQTWVYNVVFLQKVRAKNSVGESIPVRLRAPLLLAVLLRDEADERRHLLVDEASEADAKVAGDVADGGGELAAQLDHVLAVVRHGVREIHEVVDVDGVLLGGRHPEGHLGLLPDAEAEPHALRGDLEGHFDRLYIIGTKLGPILRQF